MSLYDLPSPDVTDLTEEEFLNRIGPNPYTEDKFAYDCDMLAGGDRARIRLSQASLWELWRNVLLDRFRELKKQQQEQHDETI